jgi:hypothetical protein
MKLREQTKAALKTLLRDARSELEQILKTQNVRVNVMTLEANQLRIIAQEGDYSERERSIGLASGEGVAGRAFEKHVVVVGDLKATHDPVQDWNIPEREAAKVHHDLKSVLSAPIFSEDTYNELMNDGDVIGCFNIDIIQNEDKADKLRGLTRSFLDKYASLIAHLLNEDSHGETKRS